jgi:hypothetical protein
MWFSLIGLVLDIIGAGLLIKGELLGSAAFLAYSTTGDQQQSVRNSWQKYPTWKRWALEAGSRLDWSKHLSQEAVEDSFPVKFIGFILLIVGFALQLVGIVVAGSP